MAAKTTRRTVSAKKQKTAAQLVEERLNEGVRRVVEQARARGERLPDSRVRVRRVDPAELR